MHPNLQMEIIHRTCFLTLFSCIRISTIALCLHIAYNLTMETAWTILLCLHSPDVCIDMNLMMSILKKMKLILLLFHNVKHTSRPFFNDMSLNVFLQKCQYG